MKESLEKKYVEKTITEEETAQYKKSLWIKKGIILGIYLLMVIASFVRIYRINVFFNVLGRGEFSFYSVSVVLFFLTLFLCFGYFSFQMGYMVYSEIKKKDWLELITKLNIKLDIYSFLCKCFSILLFIMIYITTPCNVVGNSMNNTLQNGDRLLCSDLFYTPHRYDIVVFDAANYTSEELFFIKRVIAVEGDRIRLYKDTLGTNTTVYINDDIEIKDINETEFKTLRSSAGADEYSLEFIVPSGKILVMGDNRVRGQSLDSRIFGLLDEKDILGKVYLRIFPFKTISTSYNY